MFKVSAEPTAPQGFKSIDWSDSSKAAADITANFAAVEGHFKSLAGEVTEGKRCSAEVREMATKAAADLTAIDRGVAELRARANIGSVDAQTGPDSMLRSFVLADSAGERLNLFTREVNYRGVQVKVPGLLDSPENYGELHTEVKRLLLGAYVHAAANAQRHENPRNLETMRRLSPKQIGRLCYLLEHQIPGAIRSAAKATVDRIFTSSSGAGGEFVPDEILMPGFDLDAKYDPRLRLAIDSIPQQAMTGAREDHVFMTGNTRPYLFGASTNDDPSKFTASSATFANRATVPQGFAIRYVADQAVVEDSTLPSIDALRPILMRDLLLALEDVVVNGDTASTHQDTALAGWNPNSLWGTTSGAGGTGDHRRGMLGLRARGFDVSNTTSFAGATTTALLFALAGTLSPPHNVADGNRLIVDYTSYLADIQTLAEILTVDKIGAGNAAILGVKVAKIGPWSIDLTPALAKTFPATGLYTAAGSTATYVGYNAARFALKLRRAIQIEVVRDPERGTIALVGTVRANIRDIDNGNTSLSSSSVKNVAIAINAA